MRMLILLILTSLLALSACAPKTAVKPVPAAAPAVAEEAFPGTDAGRILTVQVNEENVRERPNGRIIGTLRGGEEIIVLKRVGNWVQFKNARIPSAYIWAPSVGYPMANLYSPFFYFDSTRNAFHDVGYFQQMFSQRGLRRQEGSTTYELFFKNIGLGSHEAVILDVTTETQQVVEHGVTLFVNKAADRVEKVRVDYYQPIEGWNNALARSGIFIEDPADTTGGHFIWPAGKLLKQLTVDLERKEWESRYCSSIWYILPDVQ